MFSKLCGHRTLFFSNQIYTYYTYYIGNISDSWPCETDEIGQIGICVLSSVIISQYWQRDKTTMEAIYS